MRNIIIYVSCLLLTLSMSAQTFNKSYIPVSNNPSIIYNILSTDSGYKCIGVSNYQYIQGLLYFSLNDTGNITAVKYYGKPSAAYYDNYGENTVKENDNLLTTLTMIHYDTTPNVNELILYYFNNSDTLASNLLYSDTVTCSINSSTSIGGYNYSVGLRSYIGFAWETILIKSDSTGHVYWMKHYGGNDIDRGYRIIYDWNNNLIIAARSYGYYTGNNPHYTNDSQWHIYKLDTAGNVIWDKDFGNPDIRDGFPMGLLQTADSNYIITGSYAVGMSGSAELLRGRILKIDQNGNVIWSKLYGKVDQDTYTTIIKEIPNSTDLIAIHNNGWSYPEVLTSYSPIIEQLTSTGNIKWFRKYYYTLSDYGQSVLNSFDFTSDGGYIFAGYGTDNDSVPAQRSWVIKTDSLGFDGVTDFSTDTAYHMALAQDTCYGDTAILYTHLYGVTAPYSIVYESYATHDSLYYSPLYEPYITDSLILTPAMLSGSDSILNIPCTITDGLGRVLHDTLTVNVACLISGTETFAFENSIRIYPNPANENLIISVNNLQLTINNVSIIDITGKQVKSIKTKGQSKKYIVNVKDLPAGTYFVKVQTDKGDILKKFIKS